MLFLIKTSFPGILTLQEQAEAEPCGDIGTVEHFCPTLLPGQLTISPRPCVYQATVSLASVRETVVEEMAALRLPLCPLLPG